MQLGISKKLMVPVCSTRIIGRNERGRAVLSIEGGTVPGNSCKNAKMERAEKARHEPQHQPAIAEHVPTRTSAVSFTGNRSGAAAQRKLREAVDRSPRVTAQRRLSASIQGSPRMIAQRAFVASVGGIPHQLIRPDQHPSKAGADTATSALESNGISSPTGLPDNLKAGIAGLSGLPMDHVRVHYNSARPAQLHALAYTQGSNIHVSPGEEKHLPHEAWHVVQQAQGRVRPTLQMKNGVAVNDDAGLEHEADVMGARALSLSMKSNWPSVPAQSAPEASSGGSTAQLRQIGKIGMEAEVARERFKMMALHTSPEADILADPEIVLEEFSLGSLGKDKDVDVTLDNEVSQSTEINKERSFTVEFVSKAVDVIVGDVSDLDRMAKAWLLAGHFWKTNLLTSRKVIGKLGEAVEWFTKNPHWEAPQFDNYKGKRNVVPGEKYQKLDWDGPGFFTFIDAQTEDPDVSVQVTAGSTLQALDSVRIVIGFLLAGHSKPTEHQVQGVLRDRNVGHEKDHPEAWALVKVLSDYRRQSLEAALAQNVFFASASDSKTAPPKRYQKENISLMVRNSLSSVYEGMSEEGRNVFKGWVQQFTKQSGPIFDELQAKPKDAFFEAKAVKEPQANSIKVGEVLMSVFNQRRDPASSGDAFSQVKWEGQTDPLAGFGEIREDDPEQLEKYGLGHASEMMKGVTGLIAEHRAAKIRKLSEIPGLFIDLAAALKGLDAALSVLEPGGKEIQKIQNTENV